MTMFTQTQNRSAQSDDELKKRAYKSIIQLCELSVNRDVAHMSVQCETCAKCKVCKEIKTVNASSYNDFREQLVMDQLVTFTPGTEGNPGFFSSPLPLKPFNINTVRGNRATADIQNRDMVKRLQKDPSALEQVKKEMAKLQDLGFKGS